MKIVLDTEVCKKDGKDADVILYLLSLLSGCKITVNTFEKARQQRMLKFEQMYPSDDTHDYPLLDTEIVQFMCDTIGIFVDPRTTQAMNRAYKFTPFGYTMREMLGYIASAYGGNFIISDEGQLLLVPLGGLRTETYYLVTEGGDPITFGYNRILV